LHSLLTGCLPAVRGLQTLRLYGDSPNSLLQLLPTLAALHTLQLDVGSGNHDAGWNCLAAMPPLTDLTLIFFFATPPQSLLDAVGQCSRLRSLKLTEPNFGPGAFARFCATASMRHLHHLTLEGGLAVSAATSADEWRAGFSTLAQLDSLLLKRVEMIDLLLPHLAHAPALRTLTVPCAVRDLSLPAIPVLRQCASCSSQRRSCRSSSRWRPLSSSGAPRPSVTVWP